MQNYYSKFKSGMRLTDIASKLSATIFCQTDSVKGLTTFSHIKIAMSKVKINWKEVRETSPRTYQDFLNAKIDVWDFLDKRGIWAYIFDPSVNEGKGWFWEIKYLSHHNNSVSLADCVLTTKDKCIDRMIWRSFKLLEDRLVKCKNDYEKDHTPSDWKKAKKEVDGLMNLYTSTAVRYARRKQRIKAYPSLLKRKNND